MNLFLDDISSLHLLRKVAIDPSLALEPSDICDTEALDVSPVKLHRLGVSNLLGYMRVPETNSLGLLVPHAKHRVRTHGVRCSVLKTLPGDVSFLRLVSTNSDKPSTLVPESTTVYVMPPECIALAMARKLRHRVRKKNIDTPTAVLMLVKLCLELCGTYTHDPFEPKMGTVTYQVAPQMTTDRLESFAKGLRGVRGGNLLKEAAGLCYDLSGSPQESFLGPALFFDTAYGGLSLASFKANQPLDLSDAERASIDERRITPDFYLEKYRSAVEYLGHIHEEGDNPQKDHVRSLDYQTLGIREFALTYDDVRTQKAFLHSAARIAAVIAQRDGPEVTTRLKRLQRDPEFMSRLEGLFKVFRPWLR